MHMVEVLAIRSRSTAWLFVGFLMTVHETTPAITRELPLTVASALGWGSEWLGGLEGLGSIQGSKQRHHNERTAGLGDDPGRNSRPRSGIMGGEDGRWSDGSQVRRIVETQPRGSMLAPRAGKLESDQCPLCR